MTIQLWVLMGSLHAGQMLLVHLRWRRELICSTEHVAALTHWSVNLHTIPSSLSDCVLYMLHSGLHLSHNKAALKAWKTSSGYFCEGMCGSNCSKSFKEISSWLFQTVCLCLWKRNWKNTHKWNPDLNIKHCILVIILHLISLLFHEHLHYKYNYSWTCVTLWRAIAGFKGTMKSQKQLSYPKVTVETMNCVVIQDKPAQSLVGLEE